MSSISPETSPPEVPFQDDSDIEFKPPYVPPEPRTVFLGGIFTIMLLAALTIAAPIIVPIILAFILKMALYPVMRGFERLRVPRMLGAALVIFLLLGGGVAIGTALAGPAAEWTKDLPREFPRLKERLQELRSPLDPIQRVLNDAQALTVTEKPNSTVIAMAEPDDMVDYVQESVMTLLETLVILYFLLVSGDTFLRRLVEILPRFKDKKQAINISNQIESDISAYLLTITFMNLIVGGVTAGIMYFSGIEDALLWGTVAFLMNYIPIVGPIATTALFVMVGMISENDLSQALMPALMYLGAHIIESQFMTPMLLARHFTLNPVLVILGLVFFYWMWGIPGAVLSMPILAMLKVMCDNIVSLKPLGHFIEG